MVEDWSLFLTQIEELKLNIIEFDKDSIIKAKKYSLNSIMKNEKYQTIIKIIYNKYIFFANNKV